MNILQITPGDEERKYGPRQSHLTPPYILCIRKFRDSKGLLNGWARTWQTTGREKLVLTIGHPQIEALRGVQGRQGGRALVHGSSHRPCSSLGLGGVC